MKKHSLMQNKFEIPGTLIVVEGIDGSDKSTQIRLFEKWLRFEGMPVFLTEWNSSDMVKEITSKEKKKGKLTSTTFSLSHVTNLSSVISNCKLRMVIF